MYSLNVSPEKRKMIEDESNLEVCGVPRKKLLNDAFKVGAVGKDDTPQLLTDQSLSIQNANSRKHLADTLAERASYPVRKIKGISLADSEMREPASYEKDAHTIHVNSLDDESDFELHDDEPRFLFNLPGPIDTTFAGAKGIPDSILKTYNAQDSQLILYRGPPEEIVGRALGEHKDEEHSGGSVANLYKKEKISSINRIGDEMELD